MGRAKIQRLGQIDKVIHEPARLMIVALLLLPETRGRSLDSLEEQPAR